MVTLTREWLGNPPRHFEFQDEHEAIDEMVYFLFQIGCNNSGPALRALRMGWPGIAETPHGTILFILKEEA